MKKEKRILEEVNKALNLFDKLSVLEENHFLYTKIKATPDYKSYPYKRKSIFALKPVAIVFIIILNIITIIFYIQSFSSSYSNEKSLVNSLKSDYKISQTYNEYLNTN